MFFNLLPCNPHPMLIDPPCRRSPHSPEFVHHACIRKCSSGHEVPELALSWLASQPFGIKSLILYGLAVAAVPAESLCMALEMLLIAPSLPLIAVCVSSRTRCKESISCLICCCNVIKSAVEAHLLAARLCDCCCCCRGSRGPPTGSTCDGAHQRSATMSNGSLFCERNLSQRECVGRVIERTQTTL